MHAVSFQESSFLARLARGGAPNCPKWPLGMCSCMCGQHDTVKCQWRAVLQKTLPSLVTSLWTPFVANWMIVSEPTNWGWWWMQKTCTTTTTSCCCFQFPEEQYIYWTSSSSSSSSKQKPKKNSFHNLPSEAGHKNCPEKKLLQKSKEFGCWVWN